MRWLLCICLGLGTITLAAGPEPENQAWFLDPYEYEPRPDGSFRFERVEDAERRRKRQAVLDDAKDDTVDNLWKPPNDIEFQNDTTDHMYYSMTIKTNDSSEVAKYWVDVDAMLDRKGVTGNKSHPLLSNSYRRAVGAKMSFEFSFYGHKMSNLTIATGGFIYIGDQTHSWLAATQYIAPLMANFDTQLEGSNILYADDGEKFVVEWRKVQLRQQRQYGSFSFQAVLYKTGDIAFVYKDIPMNVANISDAHHPCKLGISDAYLFHHSAHNVAAMSKRVIYEYHRIEVPSQNVTSDTVVYLTAQPTCMSLTSCDDCSNANLVHFNCSWCHAMKKNGGPFCTDLHGLHRRRQQWIEGNCKDQKKSIYCTNEKEDEEIEDGEEESQGFSSTVSELNSSTMPSLDFPHESKMNPGSLSEDSSTSMLPLVLLAALIGSLAWIVYAYYNPHSSSGQLLIKYRPSRWHVPNSHVRYSASVHM